MECEVDPDAKAIAKAEDKKDNICESEKLECYKNGLAINKHCDLCQ
jgi:hypothetical protein